MQIVKEKEFCFHVIFFYEGDWWIIVGEEADYHYWNWGYKIEEFNHVVFL